MIVSTRAPRSKLEESFPFYQKPVLHTLYYIYVKEMLPILLNHRRYDDSKDIASPYSAFDQ